MSFDWKHLALGIVIGLILGMWGYSTFFCKPENSHVEKSPIIQHDTVFMSNISTYQKDSILKEFERRLAEVKNQKRQFTKAEIDSVLRANTAHDTAHDEPVSMPMSIISDYLTPKEYHRSYQFESACIDVGSWVFQNELASQNVQYSPMFVSHEPPRKTNKYFYAGGGFSYMENKVNLNAEFTYLTGNNRMITVGKSITDKSGWCASYKTPLF